MKNGPKQYRWRYICVYVFLTCLVLALIVRLFTLNVIDRSFLLSKSQARVVRDVPIAASRGIIYDRNHVPLAISARVDSVWFNPFLWHATPDEVHAVASLLSIRDAELARTIETSKHKHFVYLKRRISPHIADQIKALKIKGIFIEPAYKRFYPDAEVDAHVLGFTNINDQGQEGLELAYNHWLTGIPGIKRILRDRLGQTIANEGVIKHPKDGRDIILSIDQRLQFFAYMALARAVTKYHAKSGSVVILNPKTGEILAMANQPAFNPNNPGDDSDGRHRNRALTDMFEPGSTMKPFTVAMALESGQYTPESKIDTNPGWLHVGGYTVRDDSYNGIVDLTKLLQKSSNIAAAKIMLTLDPHAYWSFMHNIGFGQRTASGFPGESPGNFQDRGVWHPSVVASRAYGYGVAVTALQLAAGYAVLANHGMKLPVSFLKQAKVSQGKQVITPKVADQVVTMLESVLKPGGTGTRARVKGYTVAGKTGTAYIADAGGYDNHNVVSSFVGMAPAADPQLVVAVVVNQPQGKHFGALVAAPAFSRIMGGALRILNIAPINPTKS
jgi:cell division protein FtsI (penicillin-binding protein 3)